MTRPLASLFAMSAQHAQACTRTQHTAGPRLRILATRAATTVMFAAAILVAPPQTVSAETAAKKMSSITAKSLDEQVQEIKSDVLGIAAELSNLEEKLLFPSNTQIAVFVSVENGESMDVDAAQISVDGKLVTHHIYTFKEVEALEKGGVQRIYTGNVPTGAHQLDVLISGNRSAGKGFEIRESFAFKKEVDPKLVGITLVGGNVGGASIEIEDW